MDWIWRFGCTAINISIPKILFLAERNLVAVRPPDLEECELIYLLVIKIQLVFNNENRQTEW